MSANSLEHNRLLLELDKTIRELNRKVINPIVPELKLDDLCPVMSLVARCRAEYLKQLFDLTAAVGDGLPTSDQVQQLHDRRKTYEELVNSAQALETAIERGYLDVLR